MPKLVKNIIWYNFIIFFFKFVNFSTFYNFSFYKYSILRLSNLYFFNNFFFVTYFTFMWKFNFIFIFHKNRKRLLQKNFTYLKSFAFNQVLNSTFFLNNYNKKFNFLFLNFFFIYEILALSFDADINQFSSTLYSDDNINNDKIKLKYLHYRKFMIVKNFCLKNTKFYKLLIKKNLKKSNKFKKLSPTSHISNKNFFNPLKKYKKIFKIFIPRISNFYKIYFKHLNTTWLNFLNNSIYEKKILVIKTFYNFHTKTLVRRIKKKKFFICSSLQ